LKSIPSKERYDLIVESSKTNKIPNIYNAEEYAKMCQENDELYSPEINKLKMVIGNDYSFYNECGLGVHVDDGKFNYVRVITVSDSGGEILNEEHYQGLNISNKVSRDPIEKIENHVFYMPQSTRIKFNEQMKDRTEQNTNKILEIYDVIDKCNYKEYTKIRDGDSEEMIKFKTLFRNDYDNYGYTTLNLNLFPNHSIMYNRLTKGCGFDEPVNELF
jgi:hypothetical protein